jgi:hypothetical protein
LNLLLGLFEDLKSLLFIEVLVRIVAA